MVTYTGVSCLFMTPGSQVCNLASEVAEAGRAA